MVTWDVESKAAKRHTFLCLAHFWFFYSFKLFMEYIIKQFIHLSLIRYSDNREINFIYFLIRFLKDYVLIELIWQKSII